MNLQSLIQKRRYEAQVVAIYAAYDNIDDADRFGLKQPIEQIMEMPAKQLKDWTKRIIKVALTSASTRLKLGTKSITSYLTPQRIMPIDDVDEPNAKSTD